MARQKSGSAKGKNFKELTNLGPPFLDWVALANGLGVQHATRAHTGIELAEQLATALAINGPVLIEAMLHWIVSLLNFVSLWHIDNFMPYYISASYALTSHQNLHYSFDASEKLDKKPERLSHNLSTVLLRIEWPAGGRPQNRRKERKGGWVGERWISPLQFRINLLLVTQLRHPLILKKSLNNRGVKDKTLP